MYASLRFPMAAGTAALLATTAVTMPSMPAWSALPEPSLNHTAAALTALENPLTALADTGSLAANYLFTNGYSSNPATNWDSSGIGETWNALLPLVHDDVQGFLPHITSVGLIPNLMEVPFPAVRQFLSNWTLYTTSGDVTNAVSSITANGAAFLNSLQVAAGELTNIVSYQNSVMTAALTNAIGAVTAALGAGDLPGAWNAVVTGLLGPTGVAGTLLNLTIGAGVQTDPADPTTFIPSLRTAVQTTREALASALATATPPAAAARPAPAGTAAITSASVPSPAATTRIAEPARPLPAATVARATEDAGKAGPSSSPGESADPAPQSAPLGRSGTHRFPRPAASADEKGTVTTTSDSGDAPKSAAPEAKAGRHGSAAHPAAG